MRSDVWVKDQLKGTKPQRGDITFSSVKTAAPTALRTVVIFSFYQNIAFIRLELNCLLLLIKQTI